MFIWYKSHNHSYGPSRRRQLWAGAERCVVQQGECWNSAPDDPQGQHSVSKRHLPRSFKSFPAYLPSFNVRKAYENIEKATLAWHLTPMEVRDTSPKSEPVGRAAPTFLQYLAISFSFLGSRFILFLPLNFRLGSLFFFFFLHFCVHHPPRFASLASYIGKRNIVFFISGNSSLPLSGKHSYSDYLTFPLMYHWHPKPPISRVLARWKDDLKQE